ncbi:hypothetical protein EVAR_76918_1 [Eumeta japonica]|uniref:Uncharacterized protein n=1 Tax=Eumeta variegata TaxID=151549 RepID=A0A4C1SHQ9_EUMVA|nr:hypothetical protein EVAR_76918_1 [Eumeta japonica]
MPRVAPSNRSLRVSSSNLRRGRCARDSRRADLVGAKFEFGHSVVFQISNRFNLEGVLSNVDFSGRQLSDSRLPTGATVKLMSLMIAVSPSPVAMRSDVVIKFVSVHARPGR